MIRYASFFMLLMCGSSLTLAQVMRAESPETPPHHPPYRLIGKLHRPLGEALTIQGKVVEGLDKDLYGGGPNLIVHRINGEATQEFIQIRMQPLLGEFGDKESKLPELRMGAEYEFEGYETGDFEGIPGEVYQQLRLRLATRNFGFMHTLVVYEGKQLPPLVWSPADFVDRSAVITGRAVSKDGKAYIAGKDWRLLVSAEKSWSETFAGKEMESYGVIRKTDQPDTYTLEDGRTRLAHLRDLLGRKVTLRGTARNSHGRWWFSFRDEIVFVEKMDELPGWSVNMDGQLLIVEGILDEAVLPPLADDPFAKPEDLRKNLIVRQASWKPLKELEIFGPRGE